MNCILYKLYMLSPYTNPKQKTFCIFLKKQDLLVGFISCFPHGDQIISLKFLDITIFVGTFCPHYVGFTSTHKMY